MGQSENIRRGQPALKRIFGAPIQQALFKHLSWIIYSFGVTFSSVNHWENGKRSPQPFLVRRLLELKEELDRKPKRKR